MCVEFGGIHMGGNRQYYMWMCVKTSSGRGNMYGEIEIRTFIHDKIR
jgi:hypothetical protein